MPVGIQQPSNQIKFTNVSFVRFKKGKKRFELACYKNKLLEYRSGAEKDLDNVLQVPTIFLSVSKAQTAPKEDLVKAFGASASRDEIIQEILRKGEIQVGERERKELLDRVEREVLEIVSGRLVDPTTKRVYTTGMISKALDQLSSQQGKALEPHTPRSISVTGTLTRARSASPAVSIPGSDDGETVAAVQKKPIWKGVVTTKSAKSQALDAMKALIAWQPIPVMRARMRLRVTCPTSLLKQSVKHVTAVSAAGGPNVGGGGAGGGAKGKNKKNKKGGKGGGAGKDEEYDDEVAGGETTKAVDAEKSAVGGGGGGGAGSGGIVKDRILSYLEQVESQDVLGADEWEVVGFAEPGAFKGLSEFVGGETKGRGRVEILDMAMTHED